MGTHKEMLLKHEYRYLKENLERPKRVEVGAWVYQIWTNVWPRKDGVTLSTVRFDEPAMKFLGQPTDTDHTMNDDDKWRTSYEWFFEES